MLMLRLQRIGKAKKATYRLIVSEKARDTQGMYLENIGTYNPHAKEHQFQPKADRIKYWIEKGAQASDTVHNLLVNAALLKEKKKKAVYLSTKRKKKLEEQKKSAT